MGSCKYNTNQLFFKRKASKGTFSCKEFQSTCGRYQLMSVLPVYSAGLSTSSVISCGMSSACWHGSSFRMSWSSVGLDWPYCIQDLVKGGFQLLRPKVADIAKRSRTSEASILRQGSRALKWALDPGRRMLASLA